MSVSETVLQALRGGNDPRQLDHIVTMKPFSLHEERSSVGLRSAAIQTTLVTMYSALLTPKSKEVSLTNGVKSREFLDKVSDYDFCTEILDSTRGPYTMECIQNEIIRLGGKKEGTMYPSVEHMKWWNSQPRWLDVKKVIQGVQAATLSIDRGIQEKANIRFYGGFLEKSQQKRGVEEQSQQKRGNKEQSQQKRGNKEQSQQKMGNKEQSQQKKEILGVEVFYFNSMTFLGRRIRPTLPVNGRSIVFFTEYISEKRRNTNTKFRVLSDDTFGLEFNTSILEYKNDAKFPLTTFTSKPVGINERNSMSGYWFPKNGTQFKIEEYNEGWGEVDPNTLHLTQEPYAPMISFQVYRDPQNFRADFNFADKRLGSHRMKWAALTGTPGWLYIGPLGLPIVRLRPDSSIKMDSFTMNSFITMSILMTFNSLPNNFVNMEEYISIGSLSIRCIGNGTYGQGVLQVYNGELRTVGIVKKGIPYLIILRIHRADESNMYSVNGLSIGIQELIVLQGDPTLDYINIPFSSDSQPRNMIVGNGDIDIAWIRLYDYYLNQDGIKREVNTVKYQIPLSIK